MNELLITLIILLVLLVVICIVAIAMHMRNKKTEKYEDDIPLYDDSLLPKDAKPWAYNTLNAEQEIAESRVKPDVMEEIYDKTPAVQTCDVDMIIQNDEGPVKPYDYNYDMDFAPVTGSD